MNISKNDIKTLIPQAELEAKIKEMAAEISKRHEGEELHLICILKGGAYFMTDLSKYITVPVTIDFMSASSYGSGTTSSGVVKINKDLDEPIEGRHVIVVEDIIDTEKDSLRFYYLGNKYQTKIEHIGVDRGIALDQPLIL